MKTISRKKLYDKIWTITKSKTAEELNLTYNELKQICIDHNIPTPSSNYWTRLSLGKPVEKTPLPDPEKDTEIVLNHTRPLKQNKKLAPKPKGYSDILDNELAKASEEKALKSLKAKALAGKFVVDFQKPYESWTENISAVVRIFPVEDILKSRRDIIMQSKIYYKHLYQHDYDWIRQFDNQHMNYLKLKVEPGSLDRALRIFDSLISIFEVLGAKLNHDNNNTSIILNDVTIPISISEKRKRFELPENERSYYSRYDFVYSGLLRINLEGRWNTYKIEETAHSKLEDKLDIIVDNAISLVKAELDWREERRLREIEQKKKEEEARLEAERKRLLELQRDKEREAIRSMFDRLRREMIIALLDRIIDKTEPGTEPETPIFASDSQLSNLRALKMLLDPQHSSLQDSLLSEQDINDLAREFFMGKQHTKDPSTYHYY